MTSTRNGAGACITPPGSSASIATVESIPRRPNNSSQPSRYCLKPTRKRSGRLRRRKRRKKGRSNERKRRRSKKRRSKRRRRKRRKKESLRKRKAKRPRRSLRKKKNQKAKREPRKKRKKPESLEKKKPKARSPKLERPGQRREPKNPRKRNRKRRNPQRRNRKKNRKRKNLRSRGSRSSGIAASRHPRTSGSFSTPTRGSWSIPGGARIVPTMTTSRLPAGSADGVILRSWNIISRPELRVRLRRAKKESPSQPIRRSAGIATITTR